MRVLVEACVDAIDAALEAERGGANRIELCGELLQGGVTPSAGLIGAVWESVDVPVFVLIRPRAGDFLYTDAETDVMLRDIATARSLDAEGVVFGALTSHGDIDVGTVARLVEAAGPMQVTFHRAFDFARDRRLALETLIELGVDRILTSGGAHSAIDGAGELRELVQAAAGRIAILAGGGISAQNAAEVVRRSGVKEVHVRAAVMHESGMEYRPSGLSLARRAPGPYERSVLSGDELGEVVKVLASAEG